PWNAHKLPAPDPRTSLSRPGLAPTVLAPERRQSGRFHLRQGSTWRFLCGNRLRGARAPTDVVPVRAGVWLDPTAGTCRPDRLGDPPFAKIDTVEVHFAIPPAGARKIWPHPR